MVAILDFKVDTLDVMIEEERKERENKEFENNLELLYLDNYKVFSENKIQLKDNEPVNVIEIKLY